MNVYNQRSHEFEFRPGPVFANILLVDEINRTSPKTQAALLECMQERQVTVDGVTYQLPPPFMVMATQNPIEYEGTYPLPEAQLDRFTMRISIGYPPLAAEAQMLVEQGDRDAARGARAGGVAQDDARRDRRLRDAYTSRRACSATSSRSFARRARTGACYLGASPRAGIDLLRVAKARALVAGREYVDARRREARRAGRARAPAHPRARGALPPAWRRGPRRRRVERTPVPV